MRRRRKSRRQVKVLIDDDRMRVLKWSILRSSHFLSISNDCSLKWIPDVHWMCVCVCVYVAGLASDCNNKLSKIMNDNDLHSRASDELTFLVSQLLWMTTF